MTELLLIDRDEKLCNQLTDKLKQEGFVVTACHDLQSAQQTLSENPPQVVLLDGMLPDGSALELLKQLRSEFEDLPLLMLSSRCEPLDRILGLELGADDYLSKSCDPRELSARLRAVLRRSRAKVEVPPLQVGDLSLDVLRAVVSIGQQSIALTSSESKILERLLQCPNEAIDIQELAQLTLGRKLKRGERSLAMHLSHLRRKIGTHPNGEARIRTLRGRGYCYAAI